ncbi:hypothetical protein A9958_13270 (plasmid) [Staphylococcus simulans]|uniref:DUF4064 domain-containing protein n=1 Tax=Staphylococcus simulans TaxID=1286 RepID=UPI000D09CE22|nr:DUF4064 domain-containing protein [Staphylococcus simulans]AVO03400.1 hypothetical protein BI282_13265 [Staphylococcus simulans]AVO06337.1 hypothetical protein BI283_13115 [Staphylococcus simulans]AWG19948.1 hypothetical protein A9958_13270 [Staphylococcus simulans]AWI02832.1 hypothetical protein A7X73_12805 [Staphylococcus simulans]
MKVTKEKIMIFIGLISNLLATIYAFVTLGQVSNGNAKSDINDALSNSSSGSSVDADSLVSQLQNIMITFGTLSIISIILGIVALILIKKSKVSATFLIIGAVLSLNPVTFIIWLIASIFLFKKKTRKAVDTSWT